MKRISALVLALAMLLVALPAAAQFRYAPVIGVSVNNLHFKQDLFPVSKTVGFQAGVMAEMMFPGIGFGIDFGLLYNMQGATTDLGTRKIWQADGFGNENVTIHNMLIPFHLRFKWTRLNGIEDYIAPFIYGGPDFDITVAHGSIKGKDGAPNPYKYSGGDLGLTFGGGVELFKRWQVSAQYTWGMTYIAKTRKLDNQSAKSRQLSFRVAYFF